MTTVAVASAGSLLPTGTLRRSPSWTSATGAPSTLTESALMSAARSSTKWSVGSAARIASVAVPVSTVAFGSHFTSSP